MIMEDWCTKNVKMKGSVSSKSENLALRLKYITPHVGWNHLLPARFASLLPWPHKKLRAGIYIYIYRFPEHRPTRDPELTQPSPLCSCANNRFVHWLPHCSPLLPRYSPILPRCSLVLPFSHFLPLSYLPSPLRPCKFKR